MSTSTKKITIRRAEEFTPDQIDAAAHILRDGFWSCNCTFILPLLHKRLLTIAF